jgi:hypothetical protein
MAEDRPGWLIALRRGLRRRMRAQPTAWGSLGLMCIANLVVVSLTLSGPTRVSPNVTLPSGMGAVVGGIEACTTAALHRAAATRGWRGRLLCMAKQTRIS